MDKNKGVINKLKGFYKKEDSSTNTPGSDGEKKLQADFGTTQQALKFYNKQVLTHLAPLMKDFIAKQDMMFISSADAKGECDSSFRAGEPGFVMYLDDKHIIYPEYKGNGVMATMGNISENPNLSLLFLDFFETKVGLHINGKAKIILKDDLENSLEDFVGGYEMVSGYKDSFKIASYIMIEVEEAFIHCSVHIPMLKKVETDSVPTARVKEKGGDAFDVCDTPRHWAS